VTAITNAEKECGVILIQQPLRALARHGWQTELPVWEEANHVPLSPPALTLTDPLHRYAPSISQSTRTLFRLLPVDYWMILVLPFCALLEVSPREASALRLPSLSLEDLERPAPQTRTALRLPTNMHTRAVYAVQTQKEPNIASRMQPTCLT